MSKATWYLDVDSARPARRRVAGEDGRDVLVAVQCAVPLAKEYAYAYSNAWAGQRG